MAAAGVRKKQQALVGGRVYDTRVDKLDRTKGNDSLLRLTHAPCVCPPNNPHEFQIPAVIRPLLIPRDSLIGRLFWLGSFVIGRWQLGVRMYPCLITSIASIFGYSVETSMNSSLWFMRIYFCTWLSTLSKYINIYSAVPFWRSTDNLKKQMYH